jgi:hypothetical protein
LISTSSRLRKPISSTMLSSSQATRAKKPLNWKPRTWATAALRPIAAIEPGLR